MGKGASRWQSRHMNPFSSGNLGCFSGFGAGICHTKRAISGQRRREGLPYGSALVYSTIKVCQHSSDNHLINLFYIFLFSDL